MNDIFGSVRRSIVFRSPDNNNNNNNADPGTLVDKLIRKSRVFCSILQSPSPPKAVKQNDEQVAVIRWRRGELIGCGAYGQVYMGMNLDSGELLAVKQVEFDDLLLFNCGFGVLSWIGGLIVIACVFCFSGFDCC